MVKTDEKLEEDEEIDEDEAQQAYKTLYNKCFEMVEKNKELEQQKIVLTKELQSLKIIVDEKEKELQSLQQQLKSIKGKTDASKETAKLTSSESTLDDVLQAHRESPEKLGLGYQGNQFDKKPSLKYPRTVKFVWSQNT